MSYLQAQPVNRNEVKVEEIEDGLDTETVHGAFECPQCFYETNDEEDLEKHINTHKKPFQCDICMTNFTLKGSLKTHIKNKHIQNVGAKDYECTECTYGTNDKRYFQAHLNLHRGIKQFECDSCKMNFTSKGSLTRHIKHKHTQNVGAKDYQCLECEYQTNNKTNYQRHLNGHRGIRPFKCDICMRKFTLKPTLKMHIKNKHIKKGCAKDYQCSECPFRTNYKNIYQNHLNRHRVSELFQCDTCKKQFTTKGNLKYHIMNKHRKNECAKNYHCSECTFQTNTKNNYQIHLNGHRGIKAFECGTCKMKFTHNSSLKNHIKKKHT